MVGIAGCMIIGQVVPVEGADFDLATPHPEACSLRVCLGEDFGQRNPGGSRPRR
jgi:hypothetical protein